MAERPIARSWSHLVQHSSDGRIGQSVADLPPHESRGQPNPPGLAAAPIRRESGQSVPVTPTGGIRTVRPTCVTSG